MKFGTFLGTNVLRGTLVGPNPQQMKLEVFMEKYGVSDPKNVLGPFEQVLIDSGEVKLELTENSGEFYEVLHQLALAKAKKIQSETAYHTEPIQEIKSAPKDGRYAILYPGGEYRCIKIKTVEKGALQDKRILSFKNGTEFECFGFLFGRTVTFWKRFRAVNSEQRLKRITAAVQRILDDPQGTGLAYALKETKCCRCGRDLTVPASIHAGLGPGCARKGHWNKVDQKTVYQNQMQNRP